MPKKQDKDPTQTTWLDWLTGGCCLAEGCSWGCFFFGAMAVLIVLVAGWLT